MGEEDSGVSVGAERNGDGSSALSPTLPWPPCYLGRDRAAASSGFTYGFALCRLGCVACFVFRCSGVGLVVLRRWDVLVFCVLVVVAIDRLVALCFCEVWFGLVFDGVVIGLR